MSPAKHTPLYSPNNPPPLRRPDESVEDYRIRCGWDLPHSPARICAACEGFCLRLATIDEANTALAVAGSKYESLAACEALVAAAQAEAQRLRDAIARATRNAA
jgi:hypothetical protein